MPLRSPSRRPQGPDQQRVGERGSVGLELGKVFLVAVTLPRHGANYWGCPTAVTAAFRDHLPVVAVAVSAFRDHGPEVTLRELERLCRRWPSTGRPGRRSSARSGGGSSGGCRGEDLSGSCGYFRTWKNRSKRWPAPAGPPALPWPACGSG